MITKVVNVNLHQPIYERLTAKQGDIASRYLLFHLLDGDKPFDLTGRSVRVYARKPDKTEIFNDLIINDETKGYCTLELTSQCLAEVGIVKMELYISESGKVLTSIPFELEVIGCINTANAVTSTNEFSALVAALSSLQEYDNLRREIVQARKGHETVGKRLDAITQQKLDKNAILSMINMGQDVKEAMTGGGVAVVGRDMILTENIVNNQVTYSKLHTSIQGAFEEEYSDIELTINTDNSYWDYRSSLLVTDDVDISTVNEIVVNVDEKYKISGCSSYRANLYIILDSSGNILEVFPNTDVATVIHEDVKFIIPNGGVKLLLNSKIDRPTTLKKVTKYYASGDKIKYSPNSINRGVLEDKISELFEPCNFSEISVTWEDGGYFRKGTGKVVSEPNSSRVKLEVRPGDCYRISGCSYWEANLFCVMDEEGRIIQTYPNTNETTKYHKDILVKIPSNGAFLLVNQRNDDQASTISINQGYYVKNKINKKWVAFGDSLTDSVTLGGNYNYTNFVANNLGLELINLGKGGTGYLNGNGGIQQFYNRTSSIPADTDILTVFGSFNDMFVSDLNIGSITDTGTTTLYGAINTFLNNCWDINPGMTIGIISPTPWNGWWRGHSDSTRVNKCVEYVQVLKTVAEYYSLPFLDLFSCSNLRPWDSTFNEKYYKDADGVHPNTEGHKFIAPKIENFIKSIIQNYD